MIFLIHSGYLNRLSEMVACYALHRQVVHDTPGEIFSHTVVMRYRGVLVKFKARPLCEIFLCRF